MRKQLSKKRQIDNVGLKDRMTNCIGYKKSKVVTPKTRPTPPKTRPFRILTKKSRISKLSNITKNSDNIIKKDSTKDLKDNISEVLDNISEVLEISEILDDISEIKHCKVISKKSTISKFCFENEDLDSTKDLENNIDLENNTKEVDYRMESLFIPEVSNTSIEKKQRISEKSLDKKIKIYVGYILIGFCAFMIPLAGLLYYVYSESY